jgi:hypothetical protein
LEPNWRKYSVINKIRNVCLLLIIPFFAYAQEGYFQQQTDYKIFVRLNDIEHSLSGETQITYYNHSQDSLSEIWFHLYPNAYKNQNSSFAKQLIELGQADFYFSKILERGFIDSLNFTVNGEDALLIPHPNETDIATLVLNEPLPPGEKIQISTPFYVKIPEIFSRLGHSGQAYYITQWFPKPAVYDKSGWHVFPYLNMGEFYSEFGNYHVEIEVPANYRVAASGQLKSLSEREWLKNLEDNDSMEFPASDTTFKRIVFEAQNVHDFAWFADKRFCVRHEQYGQNQEIWAFFLPKSTSQWEKVPQYIRKTMDFYSSELGELPYPSISAVEGFLGVGGGMEYPGVTLIGYNYHGLNLERIVMHEVGHNWFYGVLGFNERRYPWLDEGLNSFYEHRYMHYYYPKLSANTDLFGFSNKEFNQAPLHVSSEIMYKMARSLGTDQPANLSSENYYFINYGAVIYKKTVSAFTHLMYAIGENEFRQIMQSFYYQWKNKHPDPEDLRKHFETKTDKDLSWFFDGLIGSTQSVDYVIRKHKNDSLYISNRGEIPAPFIVQYKDSLYNINGFDDKKAIYFPDYQKGEPIVIDPNYQILELNRKNNRFNGTAWFRPEPIRIRFLGGINDLSKNNLFYAPIPAFNTLDGFMPGLLLHNGLLPIQNFEYQLLPLYGTKSKALAGFGNLHWHYNFQTKWLKTIGIESRIKQFSIDKTEQYQKFHGLMYADFLPENFSHDLSVSFHFITTTTDFTSPSHFQQFHINFMRHTAIHPYSLKSRIEHGNHYFKIQFEGNYLLHYNENKGLNIKLFAGSLHYQNINNQRLNVNFRLAGTSAISDYLYEMTSINRASFMQQPEVFGAHQFVPDQGGFVLYTPITSHNQFVSLNLNSSTPFPILNIYANFATFPELFKSDFYETSLLYEAGIELSLVKNVLEIFFPIIASEKITDINENLYSKNYWQKIRFRLSLNQINPWDLRYKSYLLF